MRKRLEALKNDQKGFTLVELIVVLVILAIMAALLVPALLGYVDRAKEGKYLEEARSIYTAVQAVNDEKYATNPSGGGYTATQLTDDKKSDINKLVAPTEVTSFGSVSYGTGVSSGSGDTNGKAAFTVKGLKVTFKSQDLNTVTAELTDGTWKVTVSSATTP